MGLFIVWFSIICTSKNSKNSHLTFGSSKITLQKFPAKKKINIFPLVRNKSPDAHPVN
jgi:hypothetical protein